MKTSKFVVQRIIDTLEMRSLRSPWFDFFVPKLLSSCILVNLFGILNGFFFEKVFSEV
jgi:hypothetical protein